MPETTPAWNTTEINQMYNRKLDKDAMKLRDLVNSNASDTKIKSVIRQLNQENYRVLSICFGTPQKNSLMNIVIRIRSIILLVKLHH